MKPNSLKQKIYIYILFCALLFEYLLVEREPGGGGVNLAGKVKNLFLVTIDV